MPYEVIVYGLRLPFETRKQAEDFAKGLKASDSPWNQATFHVERMKKTEKK